MSFSVIASDPDLDTIRYTWDFGDGSALLVRTTTTAMHTYAKAGMYNFTVYVDDLTGLAGHNVTSHATASIAFNLPLTAGWNLVSVPVVGYGYKASTLGLATGDLVVSWDSATQSYNRSYILGISPSIFDFHITPTTPCWIWVAVAKTLHLYGTVPTTMQTKAFTVPATGGWVMVGFVGLTTTRHASDIFAMYSGPPMKNITLVAKYVPPGSSWVCVVLDTPMDFWLVPGQAYFCWAEASGTLSYIP